MNRHQHLKQWLSKTCRLDDFELIPLAGDASFRRYFRLIHSQQSYIVMDAPPVTENCLPFVTIATALRKIGLHTPEIHHADLKRGYLVLSDFGDRMYLKELNSQTADALYGNAMTALSLLQTCKNVPGWEVPIFTEAFMRNELELFKQWYLQNYLHKEVTYSLEKKLATCFDFLASSCSLQPYVFMHRDYHSANLMVLPDRQVGILDFQDAFYGPITYDLVSLLKDCYISWPEQQQMQWVKRFHSALCIKNSFDEFWFWFHAMGLQRHLKALLTFSRKFCRDQNSNYLQHIPRTLQYIQHVCQLYPESKILQEVLPCEA